MKCPCCPNADLLMAERVGLEIDYCPTCRGVWLDRGKLDKIIERSAVSPKRFGSGESHDDSHGDRHHDDDDHDDKGRLDGSRRKRSWLGDIFD